jgi:hypothetical protein
MTYDTAGGHQVREEAERWRVSSSKSALRRSATRNSGRGTPPSCAAALREGFSGPLFIQGDHVQTNAKKYNSPDRNKELDTLRALIKEEIAAGFYNIDIDTSTLVDLDKPTLDAQQEVNVMLAADFTEFIRKQEPKGVTVSVGGEIGNGWEELKP